MPRSPTLARLGEALADDALVHHLASFDMPYHALAVDEEGHREADDAVAACRLAVEVEERVKAVERELVEERTGPRAVFLQIDGKEHRVAATGDAVERGHFGAARLAPGRPKVHDDDLTVEARQRARRSVGCVPLEVRRDRAHA